MRIFLIRLSLEVLLAIATIDTPVDAEIIVILSTAILIEQLWPLPSLPNLSKNSAD